MPVNKIGTEYILELQHGAKSEGILCCERFIVRVHDDGGGAFLSLKAENLEPTEEYDNNAVTLTRDDITGLMIALETILAEHSE